MKKLLLFLLLMMTMMLLVACDEDRSYTIDKVTIDAVILEDGRIHVQEHYTYTFDGTFNGFTRSIYANEKNFKAFTENNGDIGEPLVTEFDEDEEVYKIFQAATDETKSVIYTYDIEGSVEKYADTNKLVYQFFDSNNESDLHDLTISLRTEVMTHSNDVYGYVRENSNGQLVIQDGILRYTNERLQAGEDSLITFLFPVEATPQLAGKKKEILEAELYAMDDWHKRDKNLPTKTAEWKPIVYTILITIIILASLFIFLHPNRTRKYMDDESLQQLLESTDPVFIDYINNHLTIRPNAVIYSLFSLKMRKVVRMEEVDSELYENEKTIRFTWLRSNTKVDAADEHLKDWLFTNKTKGKPSFLLETIVDDPDETEEERQKKGESFDEQFAIWEELIQTRPEYETVRNPYRMYPWISILFITISAGVFYAFLTFDQVTVQEMFWLQIVLGITTLIALVGAKFKFITPFYYGILVILSFVFFTITETMIIAIAIFIVAAIATLFIPAFVWTDEVGQLKKAMKQTYHHMFKQQYPLARNVELVENQLLYAVVLDVGKPFASQLGNDSFVSQLTSEPIFTFQPEQFVAIDGVANPMFYSAIALNNASSSSTTTTTSSTGGGGAGAF